MVHLCRCHIKRALLFDRDWSTNSRDYETWSHRPTRVPRFPVNSSSFGTFHPEVSSLFRFPGTSGNVFDFRIAGSMQWESSIALYCLPFQSFYAIRNVSRVCDADVTFFGWSCFFLDASSGLRQNRGNCVIPYSSVRDYYSARFYSKLVT